MSSNAGTLAGAGGGGAGAGAGAAIGAAIGVAREGAPRGRGLLLQRCALSRFRQGEGQQRSEAGRPQDLATQHSF